MPSKVMDQGRLAPFDLSSETSSFFSEELPFPAERQVGFWKPESMPDHHGTEEMSLMLGSKSISSSPLEKLHLAAANSVECLELSCPNLFKDQKAKLHLEHNLMGPDRITNTSLTSWMTANHDSGSRSYLLAQPGSLFMKGNGVILNGTHYENGLLSSSFSDILDKKLRLSSNNVPLGQSVDMVNSNFGDDEPFESMEEIEAQTIGNLLPDDDDLLSGVFDNHGYIGQPSGGDDMDDDIFCSGGGMELEADDNTNGNKTSDLFGGGAQNVQQGGLNGPFAGEHPYGEHPSRTLFVRNINSNVEDAELRALFEQYGDIRTLYTACKHRGFVMISYYDIRAARNAMRALQNKPLRHRKLDIHFSIPKDNPSEKDINQGTLVVFNLDSSVSNEDLRQIFGVYGEVKEIRETPHKHHHKFIEFYDVRAAEAALHALNRSDIAGKKIKVEPSRPGGARRCLMQQLSPELEQEELTGGKQGSPNNSPSECFGSIPLGPITSNVLENGASQDLYSAAQGPVNPFLESTFCGISSTVPQSLSSPVRIASVVNPNNQSIPDELSHSLGQLSFGFQSVQGYHPRSLPEYPNGLSNGIPYSSSNTMSSISVNINSKLAEETDNRHFHNIGSGSLNGHSFDHSEGAFGVSGNGCCPLHGHQYAWNNSNAFHHHPPGPLLWSNSPSFVNSVPAHLPPQMHGLPRVPSHMLNTVLPFHQHHVGSAPAINPSLWDRRHGYAGDSSDMPTFHPGSLGTMGFPGSPQLHALELATCNIFPRASGSCMDPSLSPAHVVIPSLQQRCPMFHGRNPMIAMPASFDAPNDRIRSRRSEASANLGDNKKQYELDIERIAHGEDSRTTLMIKNIPNKIYGLGQYNRHNHKLWAGLGKIFRNNFEVGGKKDLKYTSKMLLAAIDEHHRGTYDFIYLPIDFKNKCNVGYAFINMIDHQHIIPFYQTFNGKKWEKFNSEKVASLAYARIQGKAALIAHFQNSSLMNEDKRCRPILFHSDGPNAGDQEPFPMGDNIRSRSGRSRTAGNEEGHHGNPSTFANGEASCSGVGSPSDSTKDLE